MVDSGQRQGGDADLLRRLGKNRKRRRLRQRREAAMPLALDHGRRAAGHGRRGGAVDLAAAKRLHIARDPEQAVRVRAVAFGPRDNVGQRRRVRLVAAVRRHRAMRKIVDFVERQIDRCHACLRAGFGSVSAGSRALPRRGWSGSPPDAASARRRNSPTAAPFSRRHRCRGPTAPAGRFRGDIGPAADFIMIGEVEGQRRRLADGHEAVIAHHHHRLVAENGRQPFGLVAEPHAVESVIDGDPVVETRRRLVDGRKLRRFQRAERGRVMRMKMHDAARLRVVAVHRPMDRPGGGVDMRLHRPRPETGIDKKHVACLQLREMNAEGVHQEHLPVIRNGIGEMVGNALMHVLANGPAENGRQIAARLIDIDGDLGHGFAPL